MGDELWRWSACDLAAAIAKREVSCAEAVGAVVDRVRATNGEINAIVDDLTDEALEQAAAQDRALAAGGPLGPLHGVPVTVKINVDYKGRATTNGVEAFQSVIAPADAPVVHNLRHAGAIIVGRTNTPEFSFRATTDNVVHGRTLNPWDPERSPGGSSGGSSAACAMGYGPIAHGNDIGGSLRFPSFMCGLATVRPTQGRVPAYNPSQAEERGLLAQLMSTQGVIAREVRDVRLGTRIVAQGDPRDPLWVPAPFDGPAPGGPVKVAVTRDGLGYAIDPAITAAVDKAAGLLADAGYAVEEVDPPLAAEAADRWGQDTMGEVRVMMEPAIRKYGSPTIQAIFDNYFAHFGVSEPVALIRALADRSRLLRAWTTFLDDHPLVLTPFLMRPTYAWDEDTWGQDEIGDLFDAGRYSYLMNYLGLPAAVVPIGLHGDGDGSVPIGVQIVGQRFREDMCLDAAEAIEARVGIMARELWRRQDAAAA
ncbi:MAG: amidase family protein [Hyphomicrobiales bacterium]|nr:amidase family protein [Hyphomicrobiales bacterium]MCP5372816.1 amidase family protein [Hyphomicrobiales bacterium]